MNTILKNTLILTMITLVAGLSLGFVYEITKEPIKEQELKTKQVANLKVFEGAAAFEENPEINLSDSEDVLGQKGFDEQDIEEVLEAKDESGTVLGYVITVVSREGYGGDIKFAIGIQNDGTVNGIEILSISETAGLGMKADTDAFKGQFAGKKVSGFRYNKSAATEESEIDTISGATITTNAMTNGVNAGLAYFQEIGGGRDE